MYKNKRYEDFVNFIVGHESILEGVESSFEPTASGITLGKLIVKEMKKVNLDRSNSV